MVPATYNMKTKDVVNVCKACDWLCSAFRKALLNGEFDEAIALHTTGNVNLTTPFANIKGEVFYPVHCAVLGRSLPLLKWLVEEHCCPLKSIRVGTGGRGAKHDSFTPILTSKSRSLLNIALSNKSFDIMRYLVVEKCMLLQDEKGLPVESLLENLDFILRVLPSDFGNEQARNEIPDVLESTDSPIASNDIPDVLPGSDVASDNGANSLTAVEVNSDVETSTNLERNDIPGTTPSNECILCCSNQIDCVVMPCGHQMCCLECSNNISRCPVCQIECSFVRVYRA